MMVVDDSMMPIFSDVILSEAKDLPWLIEPTKALRQLLGATMSLGGFFAAAAGSE